MILAFRLPVDMVERLVSRFRSFAGGAADVELSSGRGMRSLAFRLPDGNDGTAVFGCSLLLGIVMMVDGT